MNIQFSKLGTLCIASVFSSLVSATSVQFETENLDAIQVKKAGLYPETISFNPVSDKFVMGSFRDGAIYEVSLDGRSKKVMDDERLKSSLGIQVDAERDRLLVVTSDIGSSIRSHSEGVKKLASVEVFELSTGLHKQSIDLGNLLPNRHHLGNGITLDAEGNAYITDSFSPVIYKIDSEGEPSIFLEDERFNGTGINLNGIVYHPDGYLLTVKKSDGVLFKIPLDNPKAFKEVKTSKTFIGGDGLLLVNSNELVLVANKASGKSTETVFSLSSKDGWGTAFVEDEVKFGDVYLTTSVIRDNKLYALHSNINLLVSAPEDKKSELNHYATIQQVGSIVK